MVNIEKEFKTVKELVEYCLEKFEETRHSDTLLFLKCCEMLGAETIQQIKYLKLNMISVHKIRQVIQNKEKKWLPSESVKRIRKEREKEIKKFMGKVG
ncbi:MAG: hypothetical protein C6W54_11065 [Bacillaceae bacterium]|nr:MAG: hypothetical protein C6W54_11065 [Bacillaceae bacterium]